MQNTFISRRAFARWAGFSALGAMAVPKAFAVSDDDASAPVLPSGDIVKSLSKDIVMDAPQAGGARNIQVSRNPLSLKVHFAFGSTKLLTQGQRQLDQLAEALTNQELSSYAFELAGHTDAVGSHASNMQLSMARANAAKAYLVNTHGLDPQRLLTIGFGFTRLADPSDPHSGANRRVEVRRLRLVAAPSRNQGAGTLVPTPKSPNQ